MKTCTNCKFEKVLGEFSKARRNKDGLQGHCRSCQKVLRELRGYEEIRRASPTYKTYTDARNKVYSASVAGRARYLLISAKKRAKDKGLECDLTVELITLFLMIGVCQRSGIKFDLSAAAGRKRRNAFAPSIDRIDNFKGYTLDNIQVVCDMYNHGKGQHTDDEFIRFCHVVAQRNPLK